MGIPYEKLGCWYWRKAKHVSIYIPATGKRGQKGHIVPASLRPYIWSQPSNANDLLQWVPPRTIFPYHRHQTAPTHGVCPFRRKVGLWTDHSWSARQWYTLPCLNQCYAFLVHWDPRPLLHVRPRKKLWDLLIETVCIFKRHGLARPAFIHTRLYIVYCLSMDIYIYIYYDDMQIKLIDFIKLSADHIIYIYILRRYTDQIDWLY